MRDIERLFNEYSESHMNPTNKMIHNLAVPAIYFSVIGLVWSIPVPGFIEQYGVNFAHIIAIPVLYYYFLLSGPIGAATSSSSVVPWNVSLSLPCVALLAPPLAALPRVAGHAGRCRTLASNPPVQLYPSSRK